MLRRHLLSLFLILSLLAPQAAWPAKLTGTVKAFGVTFNERPIAQSADHACPGDMYPDYFELGDDNGLANVLVYVKSGLPRRTYPVPKNPVVVDQVGCRYQPHVFAAMIGQPVVFRSQDRTVHTVDVHSHNNGVYGITIPANFPGGAKRFEKEEYMFPLMCSFHPWMLAFGNILPHPYFFVSEGQGRYLINDLPPGTYEIEAWHERFGKRSQTVTIGPEQQVVQLDFNYYVR